MDRKLWRKTYLWTLLSGILSALVTVVCMIATKRLMDTAAVGVFSLTNSVALTFQHIGTFDSRNAMCADAETRFPFREWFSFRLITETLMLFAGLAFTLLMGYRGPKLVVALLFLLSRAIYGVSDILQGLAQKNDRMDISSQSAFFHQVGDIAGFIAFLAFFRSLPMAALGMDLISLLVLLFFDLPRTKQFGKPELGLPKASLKSLLLLTAPLCAILFAQMFVNDMPKHAIDAYLTSEDQAVFGVIFMIAAVLPLLMTILYRPQYAGAARAWANRDVKALVRPAWICALILLGTVLLPLIFRRLVLLILGWVFGMDLMAYTHDLIWLLIGSFFSAMISLFYYILIIMKKQLAMVVIFAVTLGISIPLVYGLVRAQGLSGGIFAYMILMILLAAALFATVLITVRKAAREY